MTLSDRERAEFNRFVKEVSVDRKQDLLQLYEREMKTRKIDKLHLIVQLNTPIADMFTKQLDVNVVPIQECQVQHSLINKICDKTTEESIFFYARTNFMRRVPMSKIK